MILGNIGNPPWDGGLPYVVDYGAIQRVAERYGIPESWAGIIDQVAWSVGGEADHLAAVLWHESRMNPRAQFGYPNGSPRFLAGKATGLIQFLEGTAIKLGTSTEELYGMDFPEQMQYVQRYLQAVASGKWAGGGEGPLDTQAKMALAVFYPAQRNAPLDTPLSKKAQKSNPGVRTIGDYVQRALADTERLVPPPTTASVGGMVKLGNVYDGSLIAEISSSHAEPGRDYPTGALVLGNVGALRWPPRDSWTRRAFRLPDPPVRSLATLRRNTGDPKWFMSSAAPSTGALFVDTDGRCVQDGDDF